MMPSPILRLFRREVRQELSEHPMIDRGVFTESDMAHLPPPVQRYFRVCGWIGKPKISNASIAITRMQMRMNLKKDFIPVRSYQFNSIARPARFAYLKSSRVGFIPFSGRDKYQNGIGHMYIKLLNLFPIVDLKGPEMNRAALVTVLAETFLAPAYALQPYIKWKPINDSTALAKLTDRDLNVSGSFYFNSAGEFVRFETTDRYMTQKDGSMKQTRWVVTGGNYVERGGVRIASRMNAYWETPEGLKEYVRMSISHVRYDIKTFDEVMFQ